MDYFIHLYFRRHLEHQPVDEAHERAAPESSDSNAHRYWDITDADPLSEPEPTNYSQPQRDDVIERGDFMGYCSIQRRAEIDQTRGECSSEISQRFAPEGTGMLGIQTMDLDPVSGGLGSQSLI